MKKWGAGLIRWTLGYLAYATLSEEGVRMMVFWSGFTWLLDLGIFWPVALRANVIWHNWFTIVFIDTIWLVISPTWAFFIIRADDKATGRRLNLKWYFTGAEKPGVGLL